MRTGNLVSRLQAKYGALRKALGEEGLRDVPHVTLGRFELFVSVNRLQYYCRPLLSEDIQRRFYFVSAPLTRACLNLNFRSKSLEFIVCQY